MKRAFAAIAVVILGLAASGTAAASGAFTGRVGLTGGAYDFEETATSTGCPTCFPAGTEYFKNEDSDNTYGLQLGSGVTLGRFFVDVGAEAGRFSEKTDLDGDGQDDEVYRSDLLFTLGVFVGDRWVIFGGLRHATFGEGIFSDKYGNTEQGPFIGGGVTFRMGDRLALGASAAYNYLELEPDDPNSIFQDLKIDGFSVKLQMNVLKSPHSVFLRWQRFNGQEDFPQFFAEYEYTENYFNLGYQATFDFASW